MCSCINSTITCKIIFLDSILLNCCIEDIERFREKLKTVPKSTPNDKIHGDVSAYENALSAKDQYKATDFVCVFQKFKLAFNLLVSKFLIVSYTYISYTCYESCYEYF